MHLLPFLAWTAWAAVTIAGLCLFLLRSGDTGFNYVNLPRLLYFFWILLCVLLLSVLRAPTAAAAGLALAGIVGVWAMVGDEPARGGRLNEVVERVKGCRRALALDARNPASLELLGDVYSTLEDKALALKYWGLAYDIWSQAKLLEKMERVKRPVPVFHYWGRPCARELRACAKCERIVSRRAFFCADCGEVFSPDRPTWLATRFNALYEATGAGLAVETGFVFLPFLFLCAPWAYALSWLVWLGARRRGPETIQ
jgi:hypothetical protein